MITSPRASAKSEEPVLDEKEYVLFHPEFEEDFEDSITIDGVAYIRKCINGTLTTKHRKLVDFLLNNLMRDNQT
jgi:hypothetical protein